MDRKISVLMSLYIKTDFAEFESCFNSILNQSLLPDEIVLVFDGEVSSNIENYINHKIQNIKAIKMKILRLEKNVGLGLALNYGLLECSHNIIARVDSDDINMTIRFEKQLNYFIDNHLDVLGTFYQEFINIPGDLDLIKKQPLNNWNIYRKSKILNPISHPTVMFKKDCVLNAGSYLEMLFFEDYYLWIRMMKFGYKFGNLNEVLVYFRVGNGMFERRHGINYFKNEFKFYFHSFKLGHINIYLFTGLIIFKLPLRIMPLKLMKFVYYKYKII